MFFQESFVWGKISFVVSCHCSLLPASASASARTGQSDPIRTLTGLGSRRFFSALALVYSILFYSIPRSTMCWKQIWRMLHAVWCCVRWGASPPSLKLYLRFTTYLKMWNVTPERKQKSGGLVRPHLLGVGSVPCKKMIYTPWTLPQDYLRGFLLSLLHLRSKRELTSNDTLLLSSPTWLEQRWCSRLLVKVDVIPTSKKIIECLGLTACAKNCSGESCQNNLESRQLMYKDVSIYFIRRRRTSKMNCSKCNILNKKWFLL